MRLAIWSLYLILFPIQLLPQGSLQIADYIFLIGIFLMFVRVFSQTNIVFQTNYILKGASYFTIYTLIISSIFYFVYFDFKLIIAPLNYLYCLLCLSFVVDLSKKALFVKITFYSLITSLCIQFILFYKTGLNYNSGRYMIMFQNPNQLGLWGLIVLLMLVVIKNYLLFKKPFILYIGIIFSSFFIFVSISQAAIISLILLILFALFLEFRKRPVIFILLFFIISIFSFLFLNLPSLNDNVVTNALITRFESDLFNENDNDNNLEGRSYNRIWENPEYLVLGAGESALYRFGNDTNEIHSTFGTILFSYGFFGLLIFTIPLIRVGFLHININSIMFLIFLLFTLTHNVLRWPLFWILPYFIFCVNKKSYVRN